VFLYNFIISNIGIFEGVICILQISIFLEKNKTVTVDTNFILHNIYFIIISRQNKLQMTKETRMNVLQCFKNSNKKQEFQLNNKKFRWLLHLKTRFK